VLRRREIPARGERNEGRMSIAVIVLTQNRLHLVRQCVENVLARTSAATRELLIWDNASTDGTGAYLDSVVDPRLKVVHSPRNIGQNAYAEAVKLTSAEYLIELDDDVTGAPADWDATLLDAYRRLPQIGFLAADLEDDPNDVASHIRHHVRPHEYVPVERNGVWLLNGPAGGGCAMTSRAVNDLVGGFPQQKGKTFFLEDAAYIHLIEREGYEAAVLRDLRVHHTGGPYYAGSTPEKDRYWAKFDRDRRRRDRVKRLLVAVPFMRALNRRRGWFVEPPAAPPSAADEGGEP
jgi:GT2 family glycosyltransferase